MSYHHDSSGWVPTVPFMNIDAPAANAPLYVRDLRLADLTPADFDRWEALSTMAGTANVFAQHWFMQAALRHADPDGQARLFIVAKESGPWIGVIPLIEQAQFGHWPLPNWMGWSATNQFIGTPLVIAGWAQQFWLNLLRHLDLHSNGQMLLYLRDLACDDPVVEALQRVCESYGRTTDQVSTHHRDGLSQRDNQPAPATKASAKAQSRLRGLQRKLERDHGAVAINLLPADGDVDAWIDQFLTIERSGWKGNRGSALACCETTENLFRSVVTAGHHSGYGRLATLSAGGTPLAMSSWFVVGDHGFGFKMAYDEQYRPYAPGRQLTEAVADIVKNSGIATFDTCTKSVAQGYGHVWPDKREVMDYVITVGSPARRLLAQAMLGVRSWRKAVRERRGGADSDE